MSKFQNPAAAVAMYAKGYSLREAGDRYGVSLEPVRQAILAINPTLIRAPFRGMNQSPGERLAKV